MIGTIISSLSLDYMFLIAYIVITVIRFNVILYINTITNSMQPHSDDHTINWDIAILLYTPNSGACRRKKKTND